VIITTFLGSIPDSKAKSSKEIYDKFKSIIHTEDFDVGIFGTGYTGLFKRQTNKISSLHI